jgi:hypothetical protein
MNTREVELLLEKYFEGQTSVAEEQSLKEFFNGGPVPDHLEEYRPLFLYFKEEETIVLDDSFDEKVLARMQEPKVIPMVAVNTRRRYAIGIAASILLLIGVVFALRYEMFNRNGKNLYSASPENELAFVQAQEALLMVSANLNTGLDEMQHLEAFDKGMEKAQNLVKFDQYQVITINQNKSQSNH